jgi:glycosyltransferase involved in cell wall biosynthesis
MKVSVILPVYNTGKYIEKCVQSLIGQTLTDIEMIFVNDCTPDNAMDIVRRYAEQDNRIKILKHSHNLGLPFTRRSGYQSALGDYLVFVDSDDYLPQNAIELLYNAIEEKNVDIVCGAMQRVSDSRKFPVRHFKLSYGTDPVSVYKSLLSLEFSHAVCGKIYKKSLFANQSYETFEKVQNGEDAVLFYQIVRRANEVNVIDDIVYYYYQSPDSMTRRKVDEVLIEKMCFSHHYIYNYVRDIEELYPFFQRFEVSSILSKLKVNYDKEFIYQYSNLPDIKELTELFKWKTLSKYYSGFNLIFNWLIFNSRMTREIRGFLRTCKRLLK